MLNFSWMKENPVFGWNNRGKRGENTIGSEKEPENREKRVKIGDFKEIGPLMERQKRPVSQRKDGKYEGLRTV